MGGGGKRGPKVHQKDEMTAQRAWGWDSHEMREAAMMDQPPEDPFAAPKISDFTPINPSVPIHPKHEDAANKSKPADKPRAPRKRKIQPSATTTAAKPKKAASTKKTKRAKTAAQLDCQDISQGLLKTKPTSFGNGMLSVKAGFSFGENPLEQNPKLQRIGDASVELKVEPAFNGRQKQSKPSELADNYQTAYAHGRGNVINQATPPTPPRSDEVQAGFDGNNRSIHHDSATDPKVRDFGAPPFTQTSPPTFQAQISQGTMVVDEFDFLNSISDSLFDFDDIRSGDHGEEDEFPINDECLEEMMQSMAVPAEEEPMGSDWRPQDFSDDTLYIDEQLENDQLLWPEVIPGSDGVVYDEDPTLVAADIIDVPSLPLGSSQASCILNHVTGNAKPNRARTSEESANCFDDNDLDDDLINLMVDEPKSLQATSPAKRPSSPKLQWLWPKTYTPAKSSRISASPTDDPHFVPVNHNGDALPFMRCPFPKAIRDRSPILGLSNRTFLRICFRVGEALNAAAVASRTNVDAIIELYARVVSSSREASGGYKQFFHFGDLFTDKPPYLSGTYTFWKGVGVWDNDSKELVGEQGRGKMARVLGRIKKMEPGQGQAPAVEMIVLSIWEVDWEDVGIAKGIACPKES